MISAISVGESPAAVAVGEGAVWVAIAGDRSVAKIDPRKNEVVKTIPVEPATERRRSRQCDL